MSTRRLLTPNLARDENNVSAVVADSPSDLRQKLAQTRSVWQKTQQAEHVAVQINSEAELSRRAAVLKERAMSRLVPNPRRIEAAAKLQMELANCGAAAADRLNESSAVKTFNERVQSAVGITTGSTIAFSTTQEDAQPEMAPTSTQLIGFAASEQAQLVETGRVAAEQLRTVTTQCTDEVCATLSSQ